MRLDGGRSMVVGAEPLGTGAGISFRVWAPDRSTVDVVVEGRAHRLDRAPDGYHEGVVRDARAGMRYGFRLDGEADVLPDPASRDQPDGPHGLSRVVDPDRYAWTDQDWRGVDLAGQIITEIHVGTFTPEGTWAAAAERLGDLKDAGITLIEMMPVADFPGKFGWGYDGVGLFAPTRLYGTPDDLRGFIDRAHGLGIGVILDVVYNHLGPDGNYVGRFAKDYISSTYDNEWGDPLNFDGENSGPVRDFFTANAAYWVREFHFDGLRLDATQQIFDASPRHIVADVAAAAKAAGRGRGVIVVAENEPQDTRLLAPVESGGQGLDALWNDDFHHSARVAATGQAEAYYSDYRGDAAELASALENGFLFQGQRSRWQKNRRGSPGLRLLPKRLIAFLENHDQVANSDSGMRLATLASPGRLRALTACLLLGPHTPMLFQGQEFGSTRRFRYFADHAGDLAAGVAKGRREFMAQFPPVVGRDLPDPHAAETFTASVLDWSERESNRPLLDLHRELARLRREDPTVAQQGRLGLRASAVGTATFLRLFGATPEFDRLLIVNLGRDMVEGTLTEPLIAPPTRAGWRTLFSSEDPRWSGRGTVPFESQDGITIQGDAAVLLGAADALSGDSE